MMLRRASIVPNLLSGLLLTSMLFVGTACDAPGSGDLSELRDVPLGSKVSASPEPCGEAQELPAESVLLPSDTSEGVTVSVGFEDAQARMSGATAWEYWCACQGAGACQVQVVGNYVQCFSQSCTKCELKSRRVRSLAALEVLGTSCDPATIDEQAITERLDQLATWTSEHDYPAPIFADDGATADAPEGYGLVVEHVGGRMLTYAAPLDHFDEGGELLDFVGPTNEGGEYIYQASGGPKLTCNCEGSGDCSFQANGLCKGPCATSGSQRGCVVKGGKLTPIKN